MSQSWYFKITQRLEKFVQQVPEIDPIDQLKDSKFSAQTDSAQIGRVGRLRERLRGSQGLEVGEAEDAGRVPPGGTFLT